MWQQVSRGNIQKISYSRLQKSCNKQAEQWKTTIDLLCLSREEGHAEAGKIIRFIRGKSIVVFHCSAYVLQDFCNLLYIPQME